MARIMKANQMSKVCASFTNTHMLKKKIKNLREQNFKGTVAQLTEIMGKELTSGQKEKPQAKKKNLRPKRKTSGQKGKPHGKKKETRSKRIKNVLSASKKFCHEVFLFAVRLILLP